MKIFLEPFHLHICLLEVHRCDGDGVLTEAGWKEDLRRGTGPPPAVGGYRGAVAGRAAKRHVSLQRWLP